jgi:uncharacterized SAM-binding protein YcdF (DUF218 family)
MSLPPILTVLVVPPINMMAASIIGAIALRRWPRFGGWLLGIGLGGLLLLSIPAVSNALLVSLEAGLPLATPPGAGPPAAIVILGGDESLGADGGLFVGEDVGELSLGRVRAAAALFRRTRLPVLVSGGSLRAGGAPISVIMGLSLIRDFATPVQWVEPRSGDTWENAEFSADILKRVGITSVYVVTDAWHLRRAVIAFRHFGITVTAAVPHVQLFSLTEGGFIPTAHSWERSYYALHEWIGCAWYLTGRPYQSP